MTGKITAVGYVRIGHRDANDAQADGIRAYAASRGMHLIACHWDEGLSGAALDRPGLQAVIRDVEEGGADVVIVETVDPLGRDEEHLRCLEKLFSRNNVPLHTLLGRGLIEGHLVSLRGR